MNRNGLRTVCAASVAAGALAATAVAADPESGTVSAENPKVTWAGAIGAGSYFVSRAMILEDATANHGSVPCEQGCDRFTLTVATQKDLTVAADSPAAAADPAQTVIRIEKPDGSYLTTIGETTEGKPLTVKFKNAATGAYVIDVSDTYANDHTYAGSAALAVAPPAGGSAPPPPPPPPATQPAPGGGGQGQPTAPATGGSGQQGQNIDLTIKTGKASARKLKKSRKLVARVTVSREVARLEGVLRKGSKTIAKVSRGKTSGTVKVTLKLSKKVARKLKKGSYGLTFVARDAQGTSASKTVKVTVRK